MKVFKLYYIKENIWFKWDKIIILKFMFKNGYNISMKC